MSASPEKLARKAIKRARKLISTPEGWTTEVFARNADNEAVQTFSPNAVRFCALGALRRGIFEVEREGTDGVAAVDQVAVEQALSRTANRMFGRSLVDINDSGGEASRKAVIEVYKQVAKEMKDAGS